MITTVTDSPVCPATLCERTLQVPRGFRVGAHVSHPAGDRRYVIRNRDGAAVICRCSPCEADWTPMHQLRSLLHETMDGDSHSAP